MPSWQYQALAAYFRLARAFSRPQRFDLAQDRASAEGFPRVFKALWPAERQPVTIAGFAAEWLIPANDDAGRVLLYLHGGGFVTGSINSHRNLAINIAHEAHARALIIDYRLAPEHPFPAAIQDCLAAYHWLLDVGVPPEKLVIAGDSAGGNLTLLLLVSLRDQGFPLPAAAVCLSPATDFTATGESYTHNIRSDLTLDPAHLEYWAKLYPGDHDLRDPLISPLYADLHGLPPLLIQVGSCEMLLSDSTCFAERARAAGVDVTLEILEGGQHDEQLAANLLPEAREAIVHIGQFIESRVA